MQANALNLVLDITGEVVSNELELNEMKENSLLKVLVLINTLHTP